MGMKLRTRAGFILALVIIGAVLASAVTEYFDTEPPLKHHVTTGKVGTNPDGTVWVAEFIKDHPSIKEVTFVLFSASDLEVYKKALEEIG